MSDNHQQVLTPASDTEEVTRLGDNLDAQYQLIRQDLAGVIVGMDEFSPGDDDWPSRLDQVGQARPEGLHLGVLQRVEVDRGTAREFEPSVAKPVGGQGDAVSLPATKLVAYLRQQGIRRCRSEEHTSELQSH